ncbi:MAG: hypothetical protein CMI21_05315 [Opitutae bacterium]|jgi:ABC-2 type transport system permease protein|nr:hypothetical protein [Opitutae bacterium]HAE11296.1 hypothetical protein [Opitutae bacterium]|tara:strand:- start:2517 stop:3296 length:780 start_codon:yes stop_codon:yes gene_type:complete
MREYWVILRAELFGLFISPATYVASFYFLSLLAIGFRFFIESFATTDWILPPLASLVVGLVFGSPALIPFLTMRSFAEERRLGTLETMMSAPVGSVSLVFGKWSASYLFFLLICGFAFCFPALLLFLFPEQGESLGFTRYEQWIGGWLFLMVFGASFTSVGIFASSVTNNQMVAGMLSFTLLTLYLSLMAFSFGETSSPDSIDSLTDFWNASVGSIGNGLDKLQHFSVGLVDAGTILHQIIFTFFFLSLATLQVERLNH